MRRLAGLLAIALVASLTVPAIASDPKSDLTKVEQAIATLKAQIAEARAEKSAVAGQVAAARGRVDVLIAELAVAQARVEEIRGRVAGQVERLAQIQTQLDILLTELATTQLEQRSTRDRLLEQVANLYMESSAGFTSSVLASLSDVSDLAVGLEYAGNAAARSAELLDALRILKRQAQRQQELIETRQAEAASVLVDLQNGQSELEREAAEAAEAELAARGELALVQALLDGIAADIRAAEQHKEGLDAESKRLREEIAALQRKGGTKPGVIAWPLDGRVSSPFGYRIHPIFETRKLHTGIDIDAAPGTPIRAASTGIVILAQTYGGYGNAVVVDHGGGLSTLYAHQSKLAVSSGQVVAEGETIGYVGCTGLCTGAHLHFETREDGVPVDPMKYLGS